MPEPLSDQRRAEIRKRAHLLCVCANPKCHRLHDNALDIPELLDELDRLHTWPGLMSLLDEHYPADVQLGPDDEPGPRILALVREIDHLREDTGVIALVERCEQLRDERDAAQTRNTTITSLADELHAATVQNDAAGKATLVGWSDALAASQARLIAAQDAWMQAAATFRTQPANEDRGAQ
jgi:hypothetical protein